MIYIKRERPDSSTPLFDIATPAEIAEAHPKCGTCRHYRWVTDDGDPELIEHVCDWDIITFIEDPALDYCRHHSELNTETT